MAHAAQTITINRPVNVVFDFVLAGENNALWRPAVLAIERVPGTSAGVGAIFRQRLKGPGGRPISGDYEIVECLPNELVRFQVISGPARPAGTYRFAPLESATRLEFALHLDPQGWTKLLGPMIRRTMHNEVATVSNLKSYLEREPDGGRATSAS